MQFAGARKPPLGIVYDSDLGASIDSVLGLALLHGFEGKNEARIAALTIGNPALEAAQLCDVIEKFYASATTGFAASFFQGLPIGLAVDGKGDARVATAVLTKFTPGIRKLNDTAIAEVLIRNALSAQYDQNAAVVLAGPPSNLIRLLALPGAKDLIASKVRVLVIARAAGASDRLLSQWPTPVVIVGDEIGKELQFPASSIEKDFAYAPAHPIAEAYRAYKPMPYDAPAPAMAAALYAARPKEGYFKVSGQQLIFDPAQKEKILKVYTELASAKPVPRNFRRQIAVEEKADEADGKKPPL